MKKYIYINILRPEEGEGGRGVKMPYFDFSICYRAGKKTNKMQKTGG